ncbi:transposase [Motilibacter deserti]|uniref:transposase n=1 Tax=Motilibacter deserti TaxID=2714956 RepID=UPI0018C879A2|nr:transposase [Motilibacter deserti]
MPHTLRRVGKDDETLADLAAERTRLANRLRDALLHVHPALKRLLGKHCDRPRGLAVLAAASTPQALRELGPDGTGALKSPRSPPLAKALPAKILAALDERTATVPGTDAFGRIIAGVAAQLAAVHAERDALGKDLEAHLEAHPLAEVLTSMPGVGLRTAITWLTILGDGTAFPTAAHLATYAGLAPVTRRSGSSIRGGTRFRAANHALKSALFLSGFASLGAPASRAYYDRKRAEGKRHNAALICLARRRVDVLLGMFRARTRALTPVLGHSESRTGGRKRNVRAAARPPRGTTRRRPSPRPAPPRPAPRGARRATAAAAGRAGPHGQVRRGGGEGAGQLQPAQNFRGLEQHQLRGRQRGVSHGPGGPVTRGRRLDQERHRRRGAGDQRGHRRPASRAASN